MISSNPYHPLHLQRGITHTWMGESWMVDGGTSMMVVMKISSKSPSRQGARMEFLVPNRGFWWWQHNGSLSGKKRQTPTPFRSEGICRRKEGSRRWPRRPHNRWARPGLGRAPWLWAQATASLRLSFWLHGSSGKIGFLQYFLGFFLKVGFLHKKRHQSNSVENSVSPC
jgi:hypothetical protein